MFSEQTRKQLEELHKIQIIGIDLDILFTTVISYYIANVYNYNFYKVILIVFLVSSFIHRIFRINTRINELIFGKV